MIVTGGWTHFGNNSTPDMRYTKDDYLAEELTDAAERFMEAHQEEPFFLYLAHFGVHIPLEARSELVAKYEKKSKPETGVNHPVYAAMVEHIDISVGRVMDKLDELGLAEDTVLVFFSDNGGLRRRYDEVGDIVTSNAPLRDEKGSLYEGGIREPLIVRWPGKVEPGTTCAVPVTSVDFYPTFLDIAGAQEPEGQPLDGESIRNLLKGKNELERDAIYWHYPHYHHSTPAAAIRSGDHKLIEFFEDGHLELYNLAEDIGETTNIAEEKPELAARLQQELAQWRGRVDAAMPVENPDYDPARAGEWGKYTAPEGGKG